MEKINRHTSLKLRLIIVLSILLFCTILNIFFQFSIYFLLTKSDVFLSHSLIIQNVCSSSVTASTIQKNYTVVVLYTRLAITIMAGYNKMIPRWIYVHTYIYQSFFFPPCPFYPFIHPRMYLSCCLSVRRPVCLCLSGILAIYIHTWGILRSEMHVRSFPYLEGALLGEGVVRSKTS